MLPLFLLLLTTVSAPADEWQRHSEDFEPYLRDLASMVVSDTGHAYLLSSTDCLIYHIGPDGKLIGVFGGKGEGPGELGGPERLHFLPEKRMVVVADRNRQKLLFFSEKGTFLSEKSHKHLGPEYELAHVDQAIFLENNMPFGTPNQGAKVLFKNLQSDTLDEVLRLTKEQHSDPQRFGEESSMFYGYLPWSIMGLLTKTPSGEKAYLASNDQLQIQVINFAKKRIEKTFRLAKIPRVPLDKKQIEHEYFQVNVGGKRITIWDFKHPDYKPLIADIFSDHRGRLWVQPNWRWEATKARFHIYSTDGKQVGTLDIPTHAQFAGADDRHYWTFAEDDDGEWVVSKKAYQLSN